LSIALSRDGLSGDSKRKYGNGKHRSFFSPASLYRYDQLFVPTSSLLSSVAHLMRFSLHTRLGLSVPPKGLKVGSKGAPDTLLNRRCAHLLLFIWRTLSLKNPSPLPSLLLERNRAAMTSLSPAWLPTVSPRDVCCQVGYGTSRSRHPRRIRSRHPQLSFALQTLPEGIDGPKNLLTLAAVLAWRCNADRRCIPTRMEECTVLSGAIALSFPFAYALNLNSMLSFPYIVVSILRMKSRSHHFTPLLPVFPELPLVLSPKMLVLLTPIIFNC